ncbi:MAG: hypothetical protein U0R17_04635 [Acidimicrobiia bacterium]
MSGKKKNGGKSSGDPRKRSANGRVQPSNPSLEDQVYESLGYKQWTRSQWKKVQEYRVPGLEIFEPRYDLDSYYLALREAFCVEMELLCGDPTPNPKKAIQLHSEFTEAFRDVLQAQVIIQAKRLNDNLETFFRKRFAKRSNGKQTFEEWDEQNLGGFFANKLIEQNAAALAPITYYDEVSLGRLPEEYGIKYNFVMMAPRSNDEGDIDAAPTIFINSLLVSKALSEGYSIDQIAQGISDLCIADSVLNASLNFRINFGADAKDLSIDSGLIRAFSVDDDDKIAADMIGTWTHNAFMSYLNYVAGNNSTIAYAKQVSLLDVVFRKSKELVEEIFESTFGIDHGDLPHITIAQAINKFADRFFARRSPKACEEIKRLSDLSVGDETLSAELHLAFFDSCIEDERLRPVMLQSMLEINRLRPEDTFAFAPNHPRALIGVGIQLDR